MIEIFPDNSGGPAREVQAGWKESELHQGPLELCVLYQCPGGAGHSTLWPLHLQALPPEGPDESLQEM